MLSASMPPRYVDYSFDYEMIIASLPPLRCVAFASRSSPRTSIWPVLLPSRRHRSISSAVRKLSLPTVGQTAGRPVIGPIRLYFVLLPYAGTFYTLSAIPLKRPRAPILQVRTVSGTYWYDSWLVCTAAAFPVSIPCVYSTYEPYLIPPCCQFLPPNCTYFIFFFRNIMA